MSGHATALTPAVEREREREKDRDRERNHLFKAAYAVMSRNGYANAHVTDILNEAKLSTRAFYRHFASKDELLEAMFQQNVDRTCAHLDEQLAKAGNPTAQLLAWIDEMLEMGYDARKGRMARMFASTTIISSLADAGHEATAMLYRPLHQVLVEGAAAGDFPRCDPDNDARSIHALVWRVFNDAMHGRATLDRAGARAHILRFVFPALGLPAEH
jgi:AcrR family transcriptional regulator